jgi:hypothetical protein
MGVPIDRDHLDISPIDFFDGNGWPLKWKNPIFGRNMNPSHSLPLNYTNMQPIGSNGLPIVRSH